MGQIRFVVGSPDESNWHDIERAILALDTDIHHSVELKRGPNSLTITGGRRGASAGFYIVWVSRETVFRTLRPDPSRRAVELEAEPGRAVFHGNTYELEHVTNDITTAVQVARTFRATGKTDDAFAWDEWRQP